jgi:hypothetical protein
MTELVDKRTFLAGYGCPTHGWHVCHAPKESPGPGLEWRFYTGAEVAKRAREGLGGGRVLQRTPLDEALRATSEALTDLRTAILFEASFAWAGLAARADALRRCDGGWTVIEVKSGKAPADGRVKDEYLDDVGYTACVARQAGLNVVGASLILLNGDYRLNGAAPLLAEVEVTGEALARAAAISEGAERTVAAVQSEKRPEPQLRFECRDCEFFDTGCVGTGIPDPLFALPRLNEKRFLELRPYERVSRIPAGVKLAPTQERVAAVIRAGNPRVEAGLRILDGVVWPARYLDFEAVSPGVPWFEGRPPYDATPFQYSVHIVSSPSTSPEHREYLAPVAGDWRRELTERLLGDLGTTGSIVVYSSYEKTRLAALAELFPDLRAPLEAAAARLFDLERAFKDGYCHPAFAGSTSIKKVLPVMVPGLGYEGLDVRNGDDAAGVFALMRVGEYPADEHEGYRRKLLEYCGLDTLALVRLHQALLQLRESS